MSNNNHRGPTSARGARTVALWIAFGAVAVIFIVGGIYSGLFFLSNSGAISALAKNTAEAMQERLAGADAPSVEGSEGGAGGDVPSKQPSDPRFAFLLMGYGGDGHDGAYLTDSMMVVIVDPTKKTLTLLSLPRDAWVPIMFDGQKPIYNKLNTAYAFARDSNLYTNRLPRYQGSQGAGLLVSDTVARLLGIPISYYVALDFAGFREMIDAVGGIDVDIPDSFSAEYPANDDPSIDDSWMVVRFRKGLEHMNGERAIEYARARETIDNISEGSDFARSRRQRLIMEAFKTRLLQPDGLLHLPQLFAIAARHLDTNYTLPSIAQFTQLAMDWKNVKFFEAALTNTNYLMEATGPQGAYILVPNAPQQSWVSIRAMARRLWQNPELGAAMASTEIVVENSTGVAGVAGRVSDALAALGYHVGPPTTGPTRSTSQAVDRTGGESNALLSQLEADLGVHWSQVATEKGQGGITLQIGCEDAGLANLTVPTDSSAPSSAVGVVHAGSWSPQAEAPAPPVAHTPTPSPTPRHSPPEETAVPQRGTHPGNSTPHTTTPTPTPTHRTLLSGEAGNSIILATPATGPTPHPAPTISPTPVSPGVESPTPIPR